MSDIDQHNNLDQLIREEKRIIAKEVFSEALSDSMAEGIDLDIFADEMITGILKEMVRSRGSEITQSFVKNIAKREMAGEFLSDRILQ